MVLKGQIAVVEFLIFTVVLFVLNFVPTMFFKSLTVPGAWLNAHLGAVGLLVAFLGNFHTFYISYYQAQFGLDGNQAILTFIVVALNLMRLSLVFFVFVKVRGLAGIALNHRSSSA